MLQHVSNLRFHQHTRFCFPVLCEIVCHHAFPTVVCFAVIAFGLFYFPPLGHRTVEENKDANYFRCRAHTKASFHMIVLMCVCVGVCMCVRAFISPIMNATPPHPTHPHTHTPTHPQTHTPTPPPSQTPKRVLTFQHVDLDLAPRIMKPEIPTFPQVLFRP